MRVTSANPIGRSGAGMPMRRFTERGTEVLRERPSARSGQSEEPGTDRYGVATASIARKRRKSQSEEVDSFLC
jgi:hypothetical protein